jgi:hypothetical protein
VLDVVVVAYGSPELLADCLDGLHDHAATLGQKVVVVDNGPADAAASLVRSRWPEVELVVSGRNHGFGAAANRGIARGQAPYVLVLNPDVIVREETLDRMMALLEAHPECGIGGCRLERADGTFDHAARRSFPTPLSGLAHLVGVGHRLRGGPLAQYRAPNVERGRVDAVNGAFMLIRRAALDEVGAFDERYWMYMEDLDLCYRFGRAGWETWYEPSVSAMHLKGATASRAASPRLTLAFYRSMARFVRDHSEVVRPRWLRLPVLAGIAAVGAVAVVAAWCRAINARRQRPTLSPAKTQETQGPS